MRIERTAAGLNVLAPAKLNLFLEVLARRGDGFHEIETLMMPINLFDTLSFRDAPDEQIRLECRWATGLLKQSGASTEESRLPRRRGRNCRKGRTTSPTGLWSSCNGRQRSSAERECN